MVIPARNEPEGDNAVKSLIDVGFHEAEVRIYVVINSSDLDVEEVRANNQLLVNKLKVIASELPANYRLLIQEEENIPDKKAGVGLARKIGMDDASDYYRQKREIGVILCFDADCIAPKGYLKCIGAVFNQYDVQLAAIRYRHCQDQNTWAIQAYEAMLRYYSLSLRASGYPFWHQTVGSCMAVRSDAYLKNGGMNQKKAGEDFYFMHKLMPVCSTTTIVETENLLSSRISDRVPFGTGRAMMESSGKNIARWYTYHPDIFKELTIFMELLYHHTFDQFKSGNTWVHKYLTEHDGWSDIDRIKKNTTTQKQFVKSFLQYFNGFRVLKYVHWCRDQFVSNIPLEEALRYLLENSNHPEWNELNDRLRSMEIREVKKERQLIQ